MSATDLLSEAEIFPSSGAVSKVIGYLKESKLTEAFVDDGDATTCIVSVNDLLNVTTLETKVSSLMHQVPRLGPNNTVSDAATLMREYRTRSLPIYRDRKLVGQITSPSIVAKLLDSDAPGKISSIMTPTPVCMDVSDSVSKARETMLRKKVNQLPVTKKGALYGIVTADEIVFNLMPKPDKDVKGATGTGRYGEALGIYARKDVLTNEITESLREVYQNMSKSGSNYSVIVGTDEIQGIVTYRDYLTVLSKKAASSIPMYIVGLPDDPFEAETARTKFLGAVELLRRSVPDISEARAVIKMGETKSPKKKYEVKVFLVHPRDHYSYSVRSYELADAFDEVNNWVKELVQRSRPRKQRTPNARSYPEDFRPETAPG
ncbi:MAG: CBS domain-containing protein [Thaumarchaeota archaeon]|nr:CBS domain-containing protein [Nitrososphaerota archaeon]